MANLYRVCSGNTTQVITVTLNTTASCSFWYDVWANYHNNEYYRQSLSINLSEAPAESFTYYYYDYWSRSKNGVADNSGTTLRSVVIPAGITTYSWYAGCKEDIGQPYDAEDLGSDTYAPEY